MRSDRRSTAKRVRAFVCLAAAAATASLARPALAQDFDYLLLALTWTPSWCLGEGDPADEQCDPRRDLGFTLHGLWPQDEDGGWPEYCATGQRDPSRRQTAAMADIMGSGGLAWYQWKKHGRCAGVSADVYFAASRRAYGAITPPEVAETEVTAQALERAFLDANPALEADAILVTCREDRIQEVRICLDRSLAPRACGAGVERAACRQRGALDLPPVR